MIFTPENFLHILKNPSYLVTYYHIRKLYSTKRHSEVTTNILTPSIVSVDALSCVFMYKEIFEKEIYKFNFSATNPVIIDCGANIGLAILYWKRQFPNAKITAFEPDKKVCTVLKKNLQAHNIENVQVIEQGLWNEETTLQFFAEGSDGGRIATDETQKLTEVQTTLLSKYLNTHVDFLKIDIEGAECTVLTECQDLLTNVQNIFVEYHSFINKEQNLDQILTILRNSGFRIYIEHVGIRSEHPYLKRESSLDMDLQLNIFGYRKSK